MTAIHRLSLPVAIIALTLPCAAQNSVTIPLQWVENSSGDHFLGIDISLGGAPSKLYMFDTGSQALFSAYTSGASWWGSYTTITENAGQERYGAGLVLDYNTVSTQVDLGFGASANITIGQATNASGSDPINQTWNNNVAAGDPPLEGAFYGIMGADLSGSALQTVLAQMPGNLSSGFVVQTGGSFSSSPSVVLGLTESIRESFPYIVNMNPGSGGTFPNGNSTYSQYIVTPQYSISDGGQPFQFSAPTLLDTGNPVATLTESESIQVPDALLADEDKFIKPGATIELLVDGTEGSSDWLYEFLASTRISDGRFAVNEPAQGEEGGKVNIGLQAFLKYDIMFDIENGVVGFREVVPEPRAYALLTGLAMLGLVAWRRRRAS